MPICIKPTLTIYEDYDRLNAKEVYFTDTGDKITVKLLHYPDMKPEDIDAKQKQFDSAVDCDDDDVFLKAIQKPKPDCSSGSDGDEEQQSSPEDDDPPKMMSTNRKHLNRKLSSDMSRKKSSSSMTRGARKSSTGSMNCTGSSTTAATNQPYVEYKITVDNKHGDDGGEGGMTDISRFQDPTKMMPSKPGCLRKQILSRRSPSPSLNTTTSLSPGYDQYQKSLLEVPMPRDYGDASSDDLSSEWDSDAPDSRRAKEPKVIKLFSIYISLCLPYRRLLESDVYMNM